MADRVDARYCRHIGGHGQCDCRIEQRNFRRRLLVSARHLDVRLGMCDDGKRLSLAPCSGRGGNGNQREHRPCRLADTPIVFHLATVRQQEVCSFGTVHAAPSTQADNQIDVLVLSKGEAFFDVFGRRIGSNTCVGLDRQTGVYQRIEGRAHMTGFRESVIGHQQCPRPSQLSGELTQPTYDAVAEHQTRPGVIVDAWNLGDWVHAVRAIE